MILQHLLIVRCPLSPVPYPRVDFSQENNETHFHDTETGVELEVTDKQSLVEWIANSYKNFGATLEFITNRSVSQSVT